MPPDALLTHNRVILCHFDGYSTALVFARWPNKSLLWPEPLPEGAVPAELAPTQDGAAVREAAITALGLKADDVVLMPEFDAGFKAGDTDVRVHLLRFTTFESRDASIEPTGAVFKALSELRGSAPIELGMLREVFNLMVGGSGGQKATA